jgi:hypothetical protein
VPFVLKTFLFALLIGVLTTISYRSGLWIRSDNIGRAMARRPKTWRYALINGAAFLVIAWVAALVLMKH